MALLESDRDGQTGLPPDSQTGTVRLKYHQMVRPETVRPGLPPPPPNQNSTSYLHHQGHLQWLRHFQVNK
jgi:hypothetical protein